MQHSGNSTVRRILTDVNRTDGIYYRFAKRIGITENALGLFYALSAGKPSCTAGIWPLRPWTPPATG